MNWPINTSCARYSPQWMSCVRARASLRARVCVCIRACVCVHACPIPLVVQTLLSLLGGQPSCTLEQQPTHQEYK